MEDVYGAQQEAILPLSEQEETEDHVAYYEYTIKDIIPSPGAEEVPTFAVKTF